MEHRKVEDHIFSDTTDSGAIERGGLNHSAVISIINDAGTIQGHILGGMALIVFGYLWTYNNLFRYHIARREALQNNRGPNGSKFKSELFSTYHNGICATFPIEAILLVFTTLLTICGEVYMSIYDGEFVVTSNTQHMCVHLFFMMVAITNILLTYKLALPRDSDYAMFFVACMVEGFIFGGHAASRSKANMTVHFTAACMATLSGVFGALELFNRKSIFLCLGRTMLTSIRGTWFVTGGFMLYPFGSLPSWGDDNYYLIPLLPTMIAMNIFITISLTFVMNFKIASRVKCLSLTTICRLLNRSGNNRASYASQNVESGKKPLISDSNDDW